MCVTMRVKKNIHMMPTEIQIQKQMPLRATTLPSHASGRPCSSCGRAASAFHICTLRCRACTVSCTPSQPSTLNCNPISNGGATCIATAVPNWSGEAQFSGPCMRLRIVDDVPRMCREHLERSVPQCSLSMHGGSDRGRSLSVGLDTGIGTVNAPRRKIPAQ